MRILGREELPICDFPICGFISFYVCLFLSFGSQLIVLRVFCVQAALYSGITPGGDWGIICVARNRTPVCLVQGQHFVLIVLPVWRQL